MKHVLGYKSKNKYRILCSILFFWIFLSLFSSVALAEDKKVVIFIMDRISYQDLERGNYPVINQLRQKGAEGLMNVRSKALFFPNNSLSSYLTIGSGIRVESPEISNLSVEGEALRVVLPDVLIKRENNPNSIGVFGNIARDNGLKVGVVSSSGGNKPFYGALLMAMDEKGVIPYGNISDRLITKDNNIIGGWKTDNNNMLEGFLDIYKKSDVIFVDYSDTNRVYQNKGNQADVHKAIIRGDQFLGSLLQVIDNNTELIILSPNSSTIAMKSLNFSLTPLIIYESGNSNGYSITSNNTRRPGIVLNLDLIPTVFNYFGLKTNPELIGEPIKSIPKTSKLKGLYRELYLTNLSKTRIIVHLLFFVFLAYTLFAYKKRKDLFVKGLLCYSIISYPLSALIIGCIVSYKWYIFDGLAVLLLAIILGRLFLNLALKKDHLSSLILIGGLTSLIIVSETLFFPEVILGTPFGFNDVFIGGRFYGLNNDIMGIMLGSSTLGIYAFLEKFKLSNYKSIIIAVIYYIVLTVVLSPFFGVNVGGSITAMVMLFVSIAVLMKVKIDWKRALLLIILVMAVQVGISTLDNLLNKEVTHAGKAVHSIATEGITRVLQIIYSKLSQVALMIVVPPWNLVLGIQCYILYKYRMNLNIKIQKLRDKFYLLNMGSKVLVWGVIVGFLFNDTGVVASSLMLIYLTTTITLLLEEDKISNEADKI